MARLTMLRTIALSLAVGLCYAQSDIPETITRDVAIIGGGASGSHAAVRLREDFNKSVIVIEQRDRLGGHVDTLVDESGKSYEYGVQSYLQTDSAADFFARFNITIGVPARVPLTNVYADFATGKTVTDYVPPAFADQIEGLRRFLDAAEPYESMLLPGYWEFPAPEDIPDELMLPFGEFAQKYGFEAALPQMFQVPGPVPDFTNALTLHVMQVFGAPMARALLGDTPTFTPTEHNNMELYRRIKTLLGDDVMNNSQVFGAKRDDKGVELLVQHVEGKETIVKADRLLIAMEPTMEDLRLFDLDEAESAVFEKWEDTIVYATIVQHPSLPINTSLVNTVPEAAPDNYLAFPQSPILARFDHMGSDLFRALIFMDDEDLGFNEVWKLLRGSLSNLIEAGTVEDGDIEDFKIPAIANHGLMHLRASADDIRNGFIQDLYALQGRRSTWYTGAAWSVQYTTLLWDFNDIVLPKLLDSML